MTTTDSMQPSSSSEFGRHLQEMGRRWKLLAAVTVLVGLGVFVFRAAGPEVYQSTAVLQLRLPADVIDDGQTTEFRTESLAELATVPSVVAAAAQTAGVDGSVEEVEGRIDIGVRDTPGFLEVTATAPQAAEATSLAQAMAERLAVVGTVDQSGVTTEVVVDATDASGPVSPRPVQEGLLAAVVALLIAGESVVVIRKLRGRLSPIDTAAELERTLGTATLDVRRGHSAIGNPLPFFASHLADQQVITVLQFGGRATAEPATLVASTAAGLKQQVMLVDLDLFDPVLHDHFGHPRSPGLAEVLAGGQSLRQVARRASDANPAAVVSAGTFRSDLIGVDRVMATHRVISSSASDHAVLSITARSSLFDALVVASRFGDAVVLAVDPSSVKAASIRSVAAAVASVGARLAAIMLYSEKEATTRSDIVVDGATPRLTSNPTTGAEPKNHAA